MKDDHFYGTDHEYGDLSFFVYIVIFEATGVEIYSCGTCLKHYDFELEFKVGRRGTTNLLVEGVQDFAKVVWI